MDSLFSPRFWIQIIISTIVTMILIYLMKRFFAKVNVPVLSDVAQSV